MAKAKKKTVRKFDKVADQVDAHAERFRAWSDDELAAATAGFRARLDGGESLDDLQAEAFAVAREAASRELAMTPYRVQVYGGVVLHAGAVAEMRTGEGKTLTATLPVYLNALAGPVDVVTANAYLAERDAAWMGRVYRRLGLTCAPVLAGMSRAAKQAAYRCDVVYSTANELGFDYLRDRIAPSRALQVCTARRRAFVLIDEADQVLIDEARTPLIISGLAAAPSQLLGDVDRAVASLVAGAKDADTGAETGDYIADRADQAVFLTEAGTAAVEAALGLDDLFAHADAAYRVSAALEAHALTACDREYVVVDGEILIVDEATGRTMPGRRFGKGLHEALEVKHGLELRPEVRTQATITVQNFFRLYDRMAGMSGTAVEAADEFGEIYGLDVHVIPTNRPIARDDRDDVMFLSRDAKLAAAVREVSDRHAAGQPVLVGAANVAAAGEFSERLDAAGVPHELLNARNHHREADIIAQAGRPGAVTVATNMAGRGTDILLGGDPDRIAAAEVARRVAVIADTRRSDATLVGPPDVDAAALPDPARLGDDALVDATERAAIEAEVRPDVEAAVAADRQRVLDAGGLYVLGTERHASRRIDNQLRGRSGRQGEPGESVFYVSLEDDLLSLFSETPLEWAVTKLGERGDRDALDQIDVADPTASIKALPGADLPIRHPMMGKAVVGAQKRIEGMHFGARQSVLQYDDVVSDQRNAVYAERERLLDLADADVAALARQLATDGVRAVASALCVDGVGSDGWDRDLLAAEMARFGLTVPAAVHDAPDDVDRDAVVDALAHAAGDRIAAREAEVGPAWPTAARAIVLKVLDTHWVDLLGDLDVVRDAIGWRSLGQRDPLTEFRYEAHHRFDAFAAAVRHDHALHLLTAQVSVQRRPESAA